MNAKPIYRLSLSDLPCGDALLQRAVQDLEAAGYVVVPTVGPSEAHYPPKPALRVAIEISGHQLSDEVRGEVLGWGSTVEWFNQGRDALMVPCCVLRKDDGEIALVPLKTERTWTRIKELRQENL